jgi:hypothetical protein
MIFHIHIGRKTKPTQRNATRRRLNASACCITTTKRRQDHGDHRAFSKNNPIQRCTLMWALTANVFGSSPKEQINSNSTPLIATARVVAIHLSNIDDVCHSTHHKKNDDGNMATTMLDLRLCLTLYIAGANCNGVRLV